MNIAKKLVLAGIVSLCVASAAAYGETQSPGSAHEVSIVKGFDDLGLIFNTADILLDLESYQAGFGAKIGWKNLQLRALFDLVANGGSDSFAIDVGAALEYHLNPGPASFYVGGVVGGGYMNQASQISALHFSLGALAGVEYFLFDFLSVFAEYCLAADFTITTDLQASQTTFDYLIDTRMGNDAKLGLVFYIMRASAKK